MATSRIRRLAQGIFAFKRSFHDRLRTGKGPDPASMLRLAAVAYVRERGTPPMRELADYLCITPPSATSLINGLVAAGHLARKRDPLDRRTVRLAVTPAGAKLLRDGFKRFERHIAAAVSHLTPGEQETLICLFRKMTSPRS